MPTTASLTCWSAVKMERRFSACFREHVRCSWASFPRHPQGSLWRDIKVVHDHAYVVSEAAAHGMQVFDLGHLATWSPLDGPLVWDADTVIQSPSTAHNVVAFEAQSQVILWARIGWEEGLSFLT